MFCSKCGNQIPDGALFCAFCGAPVSKKPDPVKDDAPEASAPEQPEQTWEQPYQPEQPPYQPEQQWGQPYAPEQPDQPEQQWSQPFTPEQPPYQPEQQWSQPYSPEHQPYQPEQQWGQPYVPEQQPYQPGGGADWGQPNTAEAKPPYKNPPKKKFPILAVILPVVILVLAVAGYFVYRALNPDKDTTQTAAPSSEAEAAAESGTPGEPATEITPEQAVSRATTLLQQGNYAEAAAIIQALGLHEDDSEYSMAQDVLTIAELAPVVAGVNADGFPQVAVSVTWGSGAAPAVSVTEDGAQCAAATTTQDGTISLSYASPGSAEEGTAHSGTVLLRLGVASVELSFSYTVPVKRQAEMRFVSADVSDYPTVRLYFRIVDAATGESVNTLDVTSFTIRESIEGGKYLEREVSSVTRQEGRGLNIDLVADKSSSISSSDMQKIKQVMKEFIQSLRFDQGDRAEVLAFDTIVQQMCAYTDDSVLLVNGVGNMSTDGATALYDAVYIAVRHAALQGGARCVVAFTDGMDNRSSHSVKELIEYANSNQVPVYIIGVGRQVDESVLKNIADSTGGRYWFIDDLYDMQEIFMQVYAEQQELYVVEYTSDASAALDALRDVDVTLKGGGFVSELLASFTPVPSILGEHTSRYEVFRENVTWEQAAQRCEEMGGHLVTITSAEEQQKVIQLAESAGIKYLWLGGYTSYDAAGNVFGHWVTGEAFGFADWNDNEPSRLDQDGTEEWYIMLWYIERFGGWHWNDQRNNPVSVNSAMGPYMGFICEFED